MLWLDASDTTTMFTTHNGSTPSGATDVVGRWEDKSGNARHAVQTTDANRPVRGTSSSLATISCDGTKGIIAPSSVLTACGSTVTVYCVALRNVGATGYRTLLDGGTAGPYRDLTFYAPTQFAGMFGTGGGGDPGTDITATTFGIMMMRGTRTTTAWARRGSGSEISISKSTNSLSSPLGFGTNATGGDGGWIGHYFLVLVYRTDHDSTMQSDVRAWITTRYGVS